MQELRERRLTWSNTWHRPYESHISLAWRTLRENVLRPRRFKTQFFKDLSFHRFGHDAVAKEVKAITKVLDLADAIYCPISDEDYIKQTKGEEFFSCFIRICPACSRQQYHSNLFQVTSVSKCPFHQEELTTRCPGCGELLSPCSLNEATLKAHWGCGRCGWPNHESQERILTPSDVDRRRSQSFEPVANLIQQINEVVNNAPWLRQLHYRGHHISRALAHRIATHWVGAPEAVKAVVGTACQSFVCVTSPSEYSNPKRELAITQVMHAGYKAAQREILKLKNIYLIAGEQGQLLESRAEWSWDSSFCWYRPTRVDVLQEYIAYRWWRATFEVDPHLTELIAAPSDAFQLKPLDAPTTAALKNSKDLWERYYFLAYKITEALVARWRRQVQTVLGESKWSECTMRYYFRQVWDENVEALCLQTPRAEFPLKAVRVSPGEKTQLSPGTVMFFSLLPEAGND